MSLADLITGKRTTATARPATAILAIPARVATNQAENKPRIATIATIAIATPATDTEPATFVQIGDPVTCPYWFQVCWAVGMYQEQCTRNTACRVYKFLEVNS